MYRISLDNVISLNTKARQPRVGYVELHFTVYDGAFGYIFMFLQPLDSLPPIKLFIFINSNVSSLLGKPITDLDEFKVPISCPATRAFAVHYHRPAGRHDYEA